MPTCRPKAIRAAVHVLCVLPVAACLFGTAAPPAAAQSCSGDCNGDGQVSIAELLFVADIGLGGRALDTCPAADSSGDGAVRIGDVTTATFAYLSGCAAPRPAVPRADGVVTMHIGSASALPGGVTTFDVTIDTGGEAVAGVQIDIAFAPEARVRALANGRPDCIVNPDINKTGTQYAFQPPGCSGSACTSMRSVVINFGDLSPIPNGSVLFTCTVQVGPDVGFGQYPLTGFNAGAADPNGSELPSTVTDGVVTVGQGGPTPTRTIVPGQPGSLILTRAKLKADAGGRAPRGRASRGGRPRASSHAAGDAPPFAFRCLPPLHTTR